MKKPASSLILAFLKGMMGVLGAAAASWLLLRIPLVKEWAYRFFVVLADSASAEWPISRFLCLLALFSLLVALSVMWLGRKAISSAKQLLAETETADEAAPETPLDSEMFDVLKMFALHGRDPSSAIDFHSLMGRYGVNETQSKQFIKGLWERGFIKTTIALDGEWNSLYSISPEGLIYVRKYAH